MDYNTNINWIVAGQPNGRRLNVIKSFYVKAGRLNLSTSAIRCATMRNTYSSTKPLPASNASYLSSTAKTTTTLYSPSKPPVSPDVTTASTRTKPARNLPRRKKTCSNTAPTAPTLLIPSTSAAKNSHITTLSPSQ